MLISIDDFWHPMPCSVKRRQMDNFPLAQYMSPNVHKRENQNSETGTDIPITRDNEQSKKPTNPKNHRRSKTKMRDFTSNPVNMSPTNDVVKTLERIDNEFREILAELNREVSSTEATSLKSSKTLIRIQEYLMRFLEELDKLSTADILSKTKRKTLVNKINDALDQCELHL